MDLKLNNLKIHIVFEYEWEGTWIKKDITNEQEAEFYSPDQKGKYSIHFTPQGDTLAYEMSFEGSEPTALRMSVTPLHIMQDAYPVIPCNIFGDNNEKDIVPGELPVLTDRNTRYTLCSPRWEFRADRAAMPLAALCCEKGVLGISIDPYSETEDHSFLHNGVYVETAQTIGVSLGYTNDPCTAKNKRLPQPSRYERSKSAKASGTIYFYKGNDRRLLHEIIKREYKIRHERAVYHRTYQEAAKGLLDAFVHINFQQDSGEYTNVKCCPPNDTILKPWRNVVEIGWTGGGVLSYPLILSRDVLGDVADSLLAEAMSGEEINDRITSCYHEESGFYYDLMEKREGSRVNGWWTDFGLVRDCHCAYTNASALHYILKSVHYLKSQGKDYPKMWLDTALAVVRNVVSLQREDGNYGYTYDINKCRVLDWDGFAGCWFAAAIAYAYELTGNVIYKRSVDKALIYYHQFVRNLNCYGTPMDTWKSVDEEGNLSFIRACRIMHEITGETVYLDYLKDGADYEMLWRYGYKTKPDHAPLSESTGNWNSCGGSVTSVSNPHIHPMGAIVNEDILYLGQKLSDEYYIDRSEDGLSWLMQTLELYPNATGYGQYGVLSERWCPSDGLTVERYSDGRPYSSWFSYNLWAAADALENVCEAYLREKNLRSNG